MEETKEETAEDMPTTDPCDINKTTYEPLEAISRDEMRELRKRMPYSVRKMMTEYNKGALPQISPQDLAVKAQNYLHGK